MVQLAIVTRRAGEAEGPAPRNDASNGEGWPPDRPCRTKGASRHQSEGIFPFFVSARTSSLVASEDKNQRLRADVQQRVIPARRLVEADSAVNGNESLAKLLRGRTGYAPGVSSNVGSYEHSRVSFLIQLWTHRHCLICCLRRQTFFSRSSSHGCWQPVEVAAVIQEI